MKQAKGEGKSSLFLTEATEHLRKARGCHAAVLGGKGRQRGNIQTSVFLITTLHYERLIQAGGEGVNAGEREEVEKHYAILECYFYFKSHHV